MAINADSGEITPIKTAESTSSQSFHAIALNSDSGELYFEEQGTDLVYSIDINRDIQTAEDVNVISGRGFPDYENIPSEITSLQLDTEKNRLIAIDGYGASIQAIDIETGARTILSDNGIESSAPIMWAPISMDEDFANDRVFVVDNGSYSLFEINTVTGNRSLISGPTTPDAINPFGLLRAVAYDAETDVDNPRFYVADSEVKAIFLVDEATGARTILSDNTTPDETNPLYTPSSIELDLDNNRILVTDQGASRMLAVDITTGARTRLFGVSSPERFVFDKGNNRAIVSSSSYPSGIHLYDFDENSLTEIQIPSSSYYFEHITIDTINERALAIDSKEQITSIDLTNDTASPIESSALHSMLVRRIAYDNVNDRLLVSTLEAIYTFDTGGNITTVLSDATTPNTDLPFTSLNDIAVDEIGNRIIGIHDSDLLSIDLDSGLRSILSSNTVPDDENILQRPTHLVVDAENNRALVLDYQVASLVAVDLTTGARSVISTPTIPNGFNLFEAREVEEMVLDTGNNSVLLSMDASSRLLSIDLLTGQRAWLTR